MFSISAAVFAAAAAAVIVVSAGPILFKVFYIPNRN